MKPAGAGFQTLPLRTTSPLGIEIQGGQGVVLIPEGSLAPVVHAQTFTTVVDGQRALEIRVIRCDREHRPAGLLARFLLAGIRAGRRGEARIEIGIALDSGCGLRAWAAESGSGARQELYCSGFSAFPPEARVKSLQRLLRHFSADRHILRPSRQAGIEAEIAEITERMRDRSRFAAAVAGTRRDGRPHGILHDAARFSDADSITAFHTLAGEIASFERSSSAPISAVAHEPHILPGRPRGHRRLAEGLENVR